MPSYAGDPCSSPGPLPALALFVLPVNMAGPVVARGGHVTLMGSRKYSIQINNIYFAYYKECCSKSYPKVQ